MTTACRNLFTVWLSILLCGEFQFAIADQTFDFSFNTPSGDGFAVLDATPVAGQSGVFAIESGSLTVSNSKSDDGLYTLAGSVSDAFPNDHATSPLGAYYYNNLFYYPTTASTPLVDYWGLLFAKTDSNGHDVSEINLWYNNGAYQFYHGYGPGNYDIAQAFEFASASAVPEPSSIALLILGGVGLAICRYRRRQV